MKLFSALDAAAAACAAVVYYAVQVLFETKLVPLPALPFATVAAAAVFCLVKAGFTLGALARLSEFKKGI